KANSPAIAPLPLGLFRDAHQRNQSDGVGCPFASDSTMTCYALVIGGSTNASSSSVTDVFLLYLNGTHVSVEATLAGGCLASHAPNGTVVAVGCQLGVAQFLPNGGWIACTQMACGGGGTYNGTTPPVILSQGEAFIVNIDHTTPEVPSIGVVVSQTTLTFQVRAA
ncbi:MAG TPA: hypothetical protein VIZ68_06000, partial [Thermoplasmata archaeon]